MGTQTTDVGILIKPEDWTLAQFEDAIIAWAKAFGWNPADGDGREVVCEALDYLTFTFTEAPYYLALDGMNAWAVVVRRAEEVVGEEWPAGRVDLRPRA